MIESDFKCLFSPILFGYNYGDPAFFFLNDAELLNVVYCPKLFDFIYYGINSHGYFADFLIFMFNNLKSKKIHNAKFSIWGKCLPKWFYCCCYCRIIISFVSFQRRRISRRATSKTSLGKRWSFSNLD